MTYITPEKPSHEEWIHWSHVVADRLSVYVNAYNIPSHHPSELSEQDRQTRSVIALNFLHRLYKLLDVADTPTDSLAEVAHHDEQVIDGLKLLMRDIRDHLPALSADMQHILQSNWRNDFSSATALDIFKGSDDSESDGLGSGHPHHGRLPAILERLLEREASSKKRVPRKDLKRHESNPFTGSKWAGARRWGDENSHFMQGIGLAE